MNGNPVALELLPNYLSLSRHDGVHTGSDVPDRNVDTTSSPIAIEGLYCKASKLKDSLAYSFAGDSAGMNAHTADHDRPVDNCDAFARFCRCDGAPMARWATTYYDKIVFGSVVDLHSVWFAHWISPMLASC